MPVTNDHDWLIHFTTVQNNPWKYDEIKTKKSKMALEMKIKTNYQKKIRSKNRTISSKTSEERCYGAIPPPPSYCAYLYLTVVSMPPAAAIRWTSRRNRPRGRRGRSLHNSKRFITGGEEGGCQEVYLLAGHAGAMLRSRSVFDRLRLCFFFVGSSSYKKKTFNHLKKNFTISHLPN